MPGIRSKDGTQRFCRPCFILFIASAEVARTGRATNHQYAHGQETREFFSNTIDNGTNLAAHAFNKILPNKEHRLDSPDITRIILEDEVMMFEIPI